jgi:hypothetical protein
MRFLIENVYKKAYLRAYPAVVLCIILGTVGVVVLWISGMLDLQ